MNFIKKIILWILASWLAVFATTYYFPEYVSVEWWIRAFWVVWFIFWTLNYFIKPVLKLISLPLVFLSAWLFTFLINWIVIYLTEYFVKMSPNLWVVFEIHWWFVSYLIVAVVLWVINYITHWFVDIK